MRNPRFFQKCCHFHWLCFDFSKNGNTFWKKWGSRNWLLKNERTLIETKLHQFSHISSHSVCKYSRFSNLVSRAKWQNAQMDMACAIYSGHLGEPRVSYAIKPLKWGLPNRSSAVYEKRAVVLHTASSLLVVCTIGQTLLWNCI